VVTIVIFFASACETAPPTLSGAIESRMIPSARDVMPLWMAWDCLFGSNCPSITWTSQPSTAPASFIPLDARTAPSAPEPLRTTTIFFFFAAAGELLGM